MSTEMKTRMQSLALNFRYVTNLRHVFSRKGQSRFQNLIFAGLVVMVLVSLPRHKNKFGLKRLVRPFLVKRDIVSREAPLLSLSHLESQRVLNETALGESTKLESSTVQTEKHVPCTNTPRPGERKEKYSKDVKKNSEKTASKQTKKGHNVEQRRSDGEGEVIPNETTNDKDDTKIKTKMPEEVVNTKKTTTQKVTHKPTVGHRAVSGKNDDSPDYGLSPDTKPGRGPLSSDCTVKMTVPSLMVANTTFPVVVSVEGSKSLETPLHYFRLCLIEGKHLRKWCELVTTYHGKGSASFTAHQNTMHTITISSIGKPTSKCTLKPRTKTIQVLPINEEKWKWKQNTNRFVGDVIVISKTIVIPKGQDYLFNVSLVLIKNNVNIIVNGGSVSFVSPSMDAPTIITIFPPARKYNRWGQIRATAGGKIMLQNVYLTHGGRGKAPGRMDSGGILMALSGANLEMNGGGLVDNPSKAFTMDRASLNLNRALLSRCQGGGYLSHSLATIVDSHFVEIPNRNHSGTDNNKGSLYFGEGHKSRMFSHIRDSVFAMGEADAVHTAGAKIDMNNVVIDGYSGSGLAASGTSEVALQGVFITRCKQGLEIGNRKPRVNATDIVLKANVINIRYGDDSGNITRGLLHVINLLSYQSSQMPLKVQYNNGTVPIAKIIEGKFTCDCCVDITQDLSINIMTGKKSAMHGKLYGNQCVERIQASVAKYEIFKSGLDVFTAL